MFGQKVAAPEPARLVERGVRFVQLYHTPMGEARTTLGRDHHVDAFTMWLAGAGVKPGMIHGETDELGFGVVQGKVHVHDLHATLLHLLGFDHEQLTHRLQGRNFRLTDVHGKLVREILARGVGGR